MTEKNKDKHDGAHAGDGHGRGGHVHAKNGKTQESHDDPAVPVKAGAAHEVKAATDAKAADGAKSKEDDRLVRLMADFDNFRKRVQRERGEVWTRANEDLMRELLPVLDHQELSLANLSTGDVPAAHTEGVKMVAEQLLAVLGKFGLQAFDSEGKKFDPSVHEAISQVVAEGVPAGQVVKQTRRGYMLGGRLLRAAQVIVSAEPPEEAAASEGSKGTK